MTPYDIDTQELNGITKQQILETMDNDGKPLINLSTFDYWKIQKMLPDPTGAEHDSRVSVYPAYTVDLIRAVKYLQKMNPRPKLEILKRCVRTVLDNISALPKSHIFTFVTESYYRYLTGMDPEKYIASMTAGESERINYREQYTQEFEIHTFDQYQSEALRTAGTYACSLEKLCCGAMGAAGEAGELIDLVKKIRYQGHEMTAEARKKLILEAGDLLWYVSLIADALGTSLERVAEQNLIKLAKRYSDRKFDPERSRGRAE